MQKKLLALLLRGSSMGSKFLLIIGLSKILTTYEYGVFSLLITTLTFLMFFLGLDFYNFSHREIIDDDTNKIQFLVNQFWFHVFCYIVYIPIVYCLFSIDIIPFSYIIPFYILLVIEHLGQELFRFFNLFNKPHQANFSLLIRTGLWISIMFLVEYVIYNRELNITTILYYWISGSILALLHGFIYIMIRGNVKRKDIKFFSIDKKWIKRGVKISIPFFFGTIAYKIIEYSDRYMIDWFLDKEQVGIYSFYTNFANIVNIAVNTITITLIFPNLLRVISSGKIMKIKADIINFKKEILVTTAIVSAIIIIMIFPTLNWLNKPDFSNEIVTYFVVLTANVIFNISLLYHFLLYAYKKDKSILMPTLYACVVNIILNVIFIPKFGIIAAGFSTLISFTIILFLKRKYWLKVKRINFG